MEIFRSLLFCSISSNANWTLITILQCTRAEVLLERACLKKQGTSDILENARLWAIPVWSVSKLLNFLSGLKESPLYKPPRNAPVNSKKILGTEIPTKHKSHKHSVTASKVQKLHEPFIKIESFERYDLQVFWFTKNVDQSPKYWPSFRFHVKLYVVLGSDPDVS